MATKKFVPRGNNEGGIGDSSRRWKEVHAATGSFYNGLSGSLQTLTDGSSYLVEGSNISIVTQSNGQVAISTTGGGTMSSFRVTGSHDVSSELTISDSNVLEISGSGAISIITGETNAVTASINLDGSTLQQSASGLKVNPDLEIESLRLTGDLRVDGTTTTIETENLLVKDRFILLASGANQVAGEPPVQGGIIVASGALGDSQSLIFGASGSMWHATQGDAENGVIIAIPETGAPAPYVPLAASEFRLSGSDVRRLTTDGSNVILTSNNMLQFTGSADFKDPSIFSQGLTGSLTRIKKSDGSLIKYIEGNDEIKVTTGSFGEIQLQLHEGAGGSFSSFDFGIRDGDKDTVNDTEKVFITSSNGVSLERNDLALTASLNADTNFQFVNNQLQLADSVSIVSDLTASNAVSSSLYTFENNPTSQTFKDGQLINITGSLFWKNPNDTDALRILSGSVESGGVSFTAGDGLHLNGSDILSASLVEESEGGNLRFVNAKLDLSESISLTNISASNAVSSSYFVLGDLSGNPESGKNTLWVNSSDGNKLYLRDSQLAAGSVAADDVTLGNAPANFKTTTGDIGVSGSNIGLTGSLIEIHGENHTTPRPLIIDGSVDDTYQIRYNNSFNHLEFSQNAFVPVKLSSENGLTLSIGNQAADQLRLSVLGTTAGRISLSTSPSRAVDFRDYSDNSAIKYSSDNVEISKILTASLGVSSSLYTFENQATSPTFEDSQLINVTGSLYWKNPNDSAELKLLSGSEGGSTLTGGSNITIANDSVALDNTVGITHLTASSQVSSSLYFFKNYESGDLPPTTENSSLFNATGSLFWRNPTDGSEARILSGSAGVSFTTGDGIHLNDDNVLTASLLETGNLRFASNKLDIKENVSITNLTASNAVSSSLYTFKDVGEGTTSNYSNQLYNVTGTLYWNTNDALLSGSSGYGLVRNIQQKPLGNAGNVDDISVNKSNTTVLLTVSTTDLTGGLPSYANLPTGFYFTTKNLSDTIETEIKPNVTNNERLDGNIGDSLKLQPKSSLTFVNSGDGNYGWIVE